jgi:hypothetical protein
MHLHLKNERKKFVSSFLTLLVKLAQWSNNQLIVLSFSFRIQQQLALGLIKANKKFREF